IRAERCAVVSLSGSGYREVHHVQLALAGKNVVPVVFNGVEVIVCGLDLRIAHSVANKKEHILRCLCCCVFCRCGCFSSFFCGCFFSCGCRISSFGCFCGECCLCRRRAGSHNGCCQ